MINCRLRVSRTSKRRVRQAGIVPNEAREGSRGELRRLGHQATSSRYEREES